MGSGYKQTEVGVIPADWEVSTVGTEFSVHLGKMLDAERNFGVSKPFLGNRAVQWGRIDLNDIGEVKLTRSDLQRFRLRDGDLLVCEGGEVGRAAIWRQPVEECYYQKALHRLRPIRGYNTQLALSVLHRYASIGFLQNYVTQTSIAHLPKDKFETVPIPLPPTNEQEAIAEALTDADAFIESLEQLLAKKRQIKQGAMQELLTGKKRLPGFSGEWGIVNLDSVVERITGVWGANKPAPEHPRRADIVRAGDIAQDGLLTGHADRFLSDSELSRALCRLDDIVITTSGNGLGKVWWSDGRPNTAASNFVRILRPLPGKSRGRYLSYVLRSEAGLKQLQEHTATSAYPNLRPSFFATAWIPLPPMPEQAAVADILSDMDTEIAALEGKLAKARSIKQGMMQELLTGRIRLV